MALRRGRERGNQVDHTEVLRLLAISGAGTAEVGPLGPPDALDPKTLALARLAALVAVGGAEPSYGAETDAAVSSGATPAEIVAVLVGVLPVVGMARVVAAAPLLGLALGYDTEDALS
jgi:4-carboxymuconolactone decarboxylase